MEKITKEELSKRDLIYQETKDLNETYMEIGKLTVLINTHSKNAINKLEEITNLQKSFVKELHDKYGDFTLGSNGEIIKENEKDA